MGNELLIRKNFVPAPNYAEAFLNAAPDLKNNLTVELSLKLRKMTGFKVEQEDWNFDLVPDHLKFNFKIIDENNHILENDRKNINRNISISSKIKNSEEQF